MSVMYSEYISVSTEKLKGNTKRQHHECLQQRGMRLKIIDKRKKEDKKEGQMNTSGQNKNKNKKPRKLNNN